MAFYATSLLQNFYSAVGQVRDLFFATGGSATTFVNSSWNLLESQPETDEFKNMYVFLVTDAVVDTGESTLEGKYSLISAYVDSTWTGTMATMTYAVDSGDQLMIAKQDKFPLAQVLFCANRALENLGDIAGATDETLTTAANQTEYDLPVAVKRGLKQVWYQGYTGDANDNRWIRVTDARNEPSAAAATGVLFLPQLVSGRTIKLIYDGAHPKLTAYNSAVNDAIHPDVATAATVLECLSWYNTQDANQGANEYYLWLEGEYRNNRLPLAEMKHPIRRPGRTPKYFVAGRSEIIDTVPDPIT
jgi:hypothetical protein